MNTKAKKVLERIHLMQHVTRFNIHPIKHRQNIAEHSFGVAAMVQLAGTEINNKLRNLGVPLYVDLDFALRYAIFHDYEETVTTDIPYPLKKKLGDKIMDAIDDVSKEEIKEDWKELGLIPDRYSKAKRNMEPEFQLIKICDYAELMVWTINNKHQFNDTGYEEVLSNCRELMISYEIHQYSKTIVALIHNPSDEFTF